MTAVTLSTVGYGDLLGVEHKPLAAWYSMALILMGMGVVLYSVSVVTAFILEGKLAELVLRHYIERKAARMKRHYIICGAGQTGIHVIEEMEALGQDFIVVDQSSETLHEVRHRFPRLSILIGDATNDEVLEKAGIRKARGLIATLSNDKDNLFLAVSARLLNPDLQIISRAVDLSMADKLKKAGANYVVSPNMTGGVRIALEIIRPHVVSFVDELLRGRGSDMHFDEYVIPDEGPFGGRRLRDCRIPEKTGLTIIAYSHDGREGNWVFNPGADLELRAGGVLLFIGNQSQHNLLEKLFR